MLMVVVVVRMPTSPPVILVVLLLLALGAAFHGVCVAVCVAVRVGQQRGRGGQLLQGRVRGFYPHRGFTQQVDGVGQSRQNELKTLLEKATQRTGLKFETLSNSIKNKETKRILISVRSEL